MAATGSKTVSSRSWDLAPVEGESAKFWLTKTTVIKDIGQPTQTTETTFEGEVRVAVPAAPGNVERARYRTLITLSATEADADAALNTIRQVMIDARTVLPTM